MHRALRVFPPPTNPYAVHLYQSLLYRNVSISVSQRGKPVFHAPEPDDFMPHQNRPLFEAAGVKQNETIQIQQQTFRLRLDRPKLYVFKNIFCISVHLCLFVVADLFQPGCLNRHIPPILPPVLRELRVPS
jgi:hypothetical protein